MLRPARLLVPMERRFLLLCELIPVPITTFQVIRDFTATSCLVWFRNASPASRVMNVGLDIYTMGPMAAKGRSASIASVADLCFLHGNLTAPAGLEVVGIVSHAYRFLDGNGYGSASGTSSFAPPSLKELELPAGAKQ